MVIKEVQSLCPVCRVPVRACYVAEKGQVFLRKTCDIHGKFESSVADQESLFLEWIQNESINIRPRKALTPGKSSPGEMGECPLHCGVCENHLQTACCVLIDITNRCNQQCPYCFASAEESASSEPNLSELSRKLDLLLDPGEERSFNLQLSGGEPTVREDLPEIISMAKGKGFPYIQINTNGKRIGREKGYADQLKEAGASVIFLQFDGTTDEIYQALRGEPLFETKKKAIENCRKAGLPVTIVPTIVKNVNLNNIGSMIDFLLERVDVVKGIHFQPVSFFGRHPDELPPDGEGGHRDFDNRVTLFDIMRELEVQTGGKIKTKDLYTTTSGHPLCSFSSSYQKNRDGSVTSLISSHTKALGSCCNGPMEPLEVIKKDRDYVVNKWEISEQKGDAPASASVSACSCQNSQEPLTFDDFIHEIRSGMFSVSSMAFMDATNLEGERLKRCRVQVLSEDDRLIPFCAYNSIFRD